MWKTRLLKAAGFGALTLQYGCIAHCTFEFVTDLAWCSGPSMLPTIRPSDILLTDHISVNRRTVQVGDVVVCRSMTHPQQFVCKRIAGLEGDVIIARDSLRVPWTERHCVPRGHVWLEGDNRNNSTDSRTYGPVPYGMLRSRAFLRIWPISDIGWIRNNTES